MEEKKQQQNLYLYLEDSIDEKIEEIDLDKLSNESCLKKKDSDIKLEDEQTITCYNDMIKIYEYNTNYIINIIDDNINIIADKILKSANNGIRQFCFDVNIKSLDIMFNRVFIKTNCIVNTFMDLIYRNPCDLVFGFGLYDRLCEKVYGQNITSHKILNNILNMFLKEHLKITKYKFDVEKYRITKKRVITFNSISRVKILKDNGENKYINIDNLFCYLLIFDNKFTDDIKNLFKKIPNKKEPGKFICINNIKNIEFSTDEIYYPNKLLITIKW